MQPVQSWKCSQMTDGRRAFAISCATASTDRSSVSASPAGAATISFPQNTRKSRRLTRLRTRCRPIVSFTRMAVLPEYLINIFAQLDAHNSFLLETYTDCNLRVLICVSSFAVMNYRFGS